MLKTSPPSFVYKKSPGMLLQWKGFMGYTCFDQSGKWTEKSVQKKKVQANFISEKVMTSLLKGDTNKDKHPFPSGWIIVVMRFMLTDWQRTGRKHCSTGCHFQSPIKLYSHIPRNNVVLLLFSQIPPKEATQSSEGRLCRVFVLIWWGCMLSCFLWCLTLVWLLLPRL